MLSPIDREISCRVTRTLLMYVREVNRGSLGHLLEGLELDEEYLSDTDNWVSHAFLQKLYARMMEIVGDRDAVYKLALASERFESLGLLDRIVRLLGNPKLIYSYAPRYNRLLKLNGTVYLRGSGDSWVVLEDRYHDSSTKTRYDCDYTRGILAGIPTLFGMSMAEVEEIECQVSAETYGERTWPDRPAYGRPGCLYRVRWDSRGKRRLWPRPSRPKRIYGKAIEDLQEANRKIQAKYEQVRRLVAALEKTNRELRASQEELEVRASELHASERRYRLLAENVRDVIWILDLDTLRFTYISPSVEKARGFTAEEAMCLSLEDTLSPESRKRAAEVLAEELAKDGSAGIDPNRSKTMEIQQLCRDGTYTWAEATMNFLRDEGGRPVGVLGITRDISERKRGEEERVRLEEQMRHVQKLESLGVLAGGIAHDFNNLLMAILGNADLALRSLPNAHPARENLSQIEAASERAAELCRQMLAYSGKGRFTAERLNLSEAVREMGQILEVSISKKAKLRYELSADLPLIEADAVQIRQVVMNLITNASEALGGQPGVISVSTTHMHLDCNQATRSSILPGENVPDGRYVRLEVTDTGCGMDEATQERIFDPFFSTKFTGRGLGLAAVLGIVRGHAGAIRVRAEPGRGTTFQVFLPAAVATDSRSGRETLTAARWRGSGLILLVDDEAAVRSVAQQMLESLGFRVLAAGDGHEALEIFREHGPEVSCVLMDLTMPQMGGEEAFRELRRLRHDLRIVVASGYDEREATQRFADEGLASFVQKPYTLVRLQEALQRVLR